MATTTRPVLPLPSGITDLCDNATTVPEWSMTVVKVGPATKPEFSATICAKRLSSRWVCSCSATGAAGATKQTLPNDFSQAAAQHGSIRILRLVATASAVATVGKYGQALRDAMVYFTLV